MGIGNPHIVGCCGSLFGSLPVGQATLLEVISIRGGIVEGSVVSTPPLAWRRIGCTC